MAKISQEQLNSLFETKSSIFKEVCEHVVNGSNWEEDLSNQISEAVDNAVKNFYKNFKGPKPEDEKINDIVEKTLKKKKSKKEKDEK